MLLLSCLSFIFSAHWKIIARSFAIRRDYFIYFMLCLILFFPLSAFFCSIWLLLLLLLCVVFIHRWRLLHTTPVRRACLRIYGTVNVFELHSFPLFGYVCLFFFVVVRKTPVFDDCDLFDYTDFYVYAHGSFPFASRFFTIAIPHSS